MEVDLGSKADDKAMKSVSIQKDRKQSQNQKQPPPSQPKFVFEQQKEKLTVIGMRREKAVLHKLLDLAVKKPEDFKQMGMVRSVGIILYGPPGTGKTFLIKSYCGEEKLPLCIISPSSILSKYVGESAMNVKLLFDAARLASPCAMFIDESEVLLQSRDEISSDGNQELRSAVSEMLIETSKVHDDRSHCVFMLAATNLPWKIDMAHKRSGRFKYVLYVKPPNFRERIKLIKLYLKSAEWEVQVMTKEAKSPKEYFDREEDADALCNKVRQEKPEASVMMKRLDGMYGKVNYFLLAIATAQYSPADIEEICKVAKLNAMERKGGTFITTRSVQKALKSKEAGKSSLDPWYSMMFHTYLPEKRNLLLALVWAPYRKRELRQCKFNKADMDIYKELIKDVQRHMRWRWATAIVRALGRGL